MRWHELFEDADAERKAEIDQIEEVIEVADPLKKQRAAIKKNQREAARRARIIDQMATVKRNAAQRLNDLQRRLYRP